MFRPDGKASKRRVTYNDPGHAHELTFSCWRGMPLLSRDRTRRWFCEALDQARRKLDLELWAFCIMPEHAHVLLLPRDPNYKVAAILKAIKQPIAQKAIRFLKAGAPEYLERLRVPGSPGRIVYHFWQEGGGYDRNIRKATTAWASIRYIHENPVRRRLVRRPEDWQWSSARWYAGCPDAVLAMDACPPDPEPR